MQRDRYLCFVHGEVWVYTMEGGTSGPAPYGEAMTLPFIEINDIPDKVEIEGWRITKEEYLKEREQYGHDS